MIEKILRHIIANPKNPNYTHLVWQEQIQGYIAYRIKENDIIFIDEDENDISNNWDFEYERNESGEYKIWIGDDEIEYNPYGV